MHKPHHHDKVADHGGELQLHVYEYLNRGVVNLSIGVLQLLKSTIATSSPALFQPSGTPSSDSADSQSLAAVLPAALPAERDYCDDVRMATVRCVSALFLYLQQSSLSDTRDLLQPASMMLLSSCPVGCFDLLVAYLQSSAAAATRTLTSADADSVGIDADSVDICQFHSLLPDIVTGPVKAVAWHPNVAKLEEMIKSVQPLSG